MTSKSHSGLGLTLAMALAVVSATVSTSTANDDNPHEIYLKLLGQETQSAARPEVVFSASSDRNQIRIAPKTGQPLLIESKELSGPFVTFIEAYLEALILRMGLRFDAPGPGTYPLKVVRVTPMVLDARSEYLAVESASFSLDEILRMAEQELWEDLKSKQDLVIPADVGGIASRVRQFFKFNDELMGKMDETRLKTLRERMALRLLERVGPIASRMSGAVRIPERADPGVAPRSGQGFEDRLSHMNPESLEEITRSLRAIESDLNSIKGVQNSAPVHFSPLETLLSGERGESVLSRKWSILSSIGSFKVQLLKLYQAFPRDLNLRGELVRLGSRLNVLLDQASSCGVQAGQSFYAAFTDSEIADARFDAERDLPEAAKKIAQMACDSRLMPNYVAPTE